MDKNCYWCREKTIHTIIPATCKCLVNGNGDANRPEIKAHFAQYFDYDPVSNGYSGFQFCPKCWHKMFEPYFCQLDKKLFEQQSDDDDEFKIYNQTLYILTETTPFCPLCKKEYSLEKCLSGEQVKHFLNLIPEIKFEINI